VNGKRYIGCAVDIRRRIIRHFSELKQHFHTNSVLQRAYDKYGRENFKDYVIQELKKDEDILECMEIYWIAYHNSYVGDGGGYNLTRGGYGPLGRIMSEESKKKLSESKKGLHPTEETRQKLRDWIRTPEMFEQIKRTKKANPKPNKNKGFHHSEETKKHLSEVRTGMKLSEENCKAIGIGQQGLKSAKNTSSKYVGVTFSKQKNKWLASIFFEKHHYHIGTFLYEVEAAMAYNEFALELYGYKAKLNDIPQEEIDNLWNLE
jgi:group I intron endonuclease